MNFFVISMAIIIILCFIGIFIMYTYNRFQNLIIRLNEVEANIDSVLRKRYDLLFKVNAILTTLGTTKITEELENLRSQKISNFDFDRKLIRLIVEFTKYKEKYPELRQNDNFVKLDIELSESEAEIVAFRKYYNDIVTNYNGLRHAFPSNIVALFFEYKDKNYYDGKDLFDDDTEDFKL